MAENRILECSRLIADRELTIAFAESATAGWLCSEFALAPESGKILMGGIVCYDASLKETLLNVSKELIKKYTPESMEVTEELAKRLGVLIGSDIQLAITGLTTPGGSETQEKPVGTMFIAASINGRIVKARKVFNGSCEDVIHQTVQAAADLLINELTQ
jgi:nicotinamide-nucleotide amidase